MNILTNQTGYFTPTKDIPLAVIHRIKISVELSVYQGFAGLIGVGFLFCRHLLANPGAGGIDDTIDDDPGHPLLCSFFDGPALSCSGVAKNSLVLISNTGSFSHSAEWGSDIWDLKKAI